jgi:hypothetical protein
MIEDSEKSWPKKFGSADADDWNSGKSRRKYPGRQKKRRESDRHENL